MGRNKKHTKSERHYPLFWEKVVPLAIGILVVIILIIVLLIFAIALGLFFGP